MNCSREVPTKAQVAKMPGLDQYADKFYDDVSNFKTVILIGRNCIKAQRQRQFTDSRNQTQIVTETPLGWCIIGKTAPTPKSKVYASALNGKGKAPDHQLKDSQSSRSRETSHKTQTQTIGDKERIWKIPIPPGSDRKSFSLPKQNGNTYQPPHRRQKDILENKRRQQPQRPENRKPVATKPLGPQSESLPPQTKLPREDRNQHQKRVPKNPTVGIADITEIGREARMQPTTSALDIEDIEDICSEIGMADTTEIGTDKQAASSSNEPASLIEEHEAEHRSNQEDTHTTVEPTQQETEKPTSPQVSTGEQVLLTSESSEQDEHADAGTEQDAPATHGNMAQDAQTAAKPSGSITHPTETDDEEEGAVTRTSKRRNPLKEQHKVLITGLDTDLDHYDPDGPEVDLTDALEYTIGPVKTMQIERCPTPQGEGLLGIAEVAFYTKEDAMACLDTSAREQLYCHGTQLHAKAVEQVTEKPTISATALRTSENTPKPATEQGTSNSTDQTKSSQENTGEHALLTSQDQTDLQSAVPDTEHNTAQLSQSEHQETENVPTTTSGIATHPKEQHKVLLSGLNTDLAYYDPDGPTVWITEELEGQCGAVKQVQMHRQTTLQGECLLGTAEVAFYSSDDALQCIGRSLRGGLMVLDAKVTAELIDPVTGKPTPAKQYKVIFSKIDCDLGRYTPDGPEEDLRQMLEFYYGPVLSVLMKRSSTPLGECMLGTAEVTFATPKAAQKCIKASDEKWLELHGRHLHAKMA